VARRCRGDPRRRLARDRLHTPRRPGAEGLAPDARPAPFAVVPAASDVVCEGDDDPCDANVARAARAGRRRPPSGLRGARPGDLNLCELTRRGALVRGLLTTRDANGVRSFDRLAAAAPRGGKSPSSRSAAI
jgi:hypothetical protein